MQEHRFIRWPAVALCAAVIGIAGLATSSPPAPASFEQLPGPEHALAPGVVTLAHAATPQRPVALQLFRARYLGRPVLCIQQVPQGDGQCASYPIGPASRYARASSDLWLLAEGRGSCKPPRYEVITAIVLHPGLTAWLRTSAGTERMATAAVPKVFGVTGPLVYAVLTRGPDTIVLRDSHGATAYTTPAVSGAVPPPGTPAYCGGLNPVTTS